VSFSTATGVYTNYGSLFATFQTSVPAGMSALVRGLFTQRPIFKPLTRAWPGIKELHLWTFFVLAAVLVVQIIVLLYQNKGRMAALILHQPFPLLR
jgi:hypothetical protein